MHQLSHTALNTQLHYVQRGQSNFKKLPGYSEQVNSRL